MKGLLTQPVRVQQPPTQQPAQQPAQQQPVTQQPVPQQLVKPPAQLPVQPPVQPPVLQTVQKQAQVQVPAPTAAAATPSASWLAVLQGSAPPTPNTQAYMPEGYKFTEVTGDVLKAGTAGNVWYELEGTEGSGVRLIGGYSLGM